MKQHPHKRRKTCVIPHVGGTISISYLGFIPTEPFDYARNPNEPLPGDTIASYLMRYAQDEKDAFRLYTALRTIILFTVDCRGDSSEDLPLDVWLYILKWTFTGYIVNLKDNIYNAAMKTSSLGYHNVVADFDPPHFWRLDDPFQQTCLPLSVYAEHQMKYALNRYHNAYIYIGHMTSYYIMSTKSYIFQYSDDCKDVYIFGFIINPLNDISSLAVTSGKKLEGSIRDFIPVDKSKTFYRPETADSINLSKAVYIPNPHREDLCTLASEYRYKPRQSSVLTIQMKSNDHRESPFVSYYAMRMTEKF